MVADGASSNRKFFACHSIEKYKKMGITYKAPNLTLPGQFVYFMVDVPHLMKTTRNAWSNSQAKGTRHLEVIILEYSISLFVTGFSKRGLPHTSTLPPSTTHNFGPVKPMDL